MNMSKRMKTEKCMECSGNRIVRMFGRRRASADRPGTGKGFEWQDEGFVHTDS